MPLPSRQQVVSIATEQARRHRRLLKGFGIFLVIVAVLGFLVAPPIVRSVAQTQLTKLLHRQVTVADVAINPFALSATVKGFSIAEPEGGSEALGFDRLYVNLEAQSLFHGGPMLREIQLEVPRLKLRRATDGRYNWQDLIDEFLAKPPSEEKAVFAAYNIQVSGGQIDFDDQAEGVVQKVTGLRIGLPFISSIPSQVDIFVEPVVSATVNGRPFGLTGRAQPFSAEREATLEVKLDGLDLPGYLAYLPFEPAFNVPSAKLFTDLVVSFKQPPGGGALLSVKGSVALGDVEVQDKADAPVLKLAGLGVDIDEADITRRHIHLSRVRVEDPQAEVRRLADGSLNLLGLLPPRGAAVPETLPANVPLLAPAKPLSWRVDRIEVAGGRVGLGDAMVQPAFATHLQDIQVEVQGLASEGDPAEVKLSLVTEAGEKVEHTGSLRPQPLEASGELKVTGLLLPRYGAYAAAALPGGQVEGGKLDATLTYSLTPGDKGPVVKLGLPRAVLADLAVRLKAEKAPVVQVGRVEVADGKVDLAARSATLGRVLVDRPKLDVLRDKEGRFNALGLRGDRRAAAVVRPDQPEDHRGANPQRLPAGWGEVAGAGRRRGRVVHRRRCVERQACAVHRRVFCQRFEREDRPQHGHPRRGVGSGRTRQGVGPAERPA